MDEQGRIRRAEGYLNGGKSGEGNEAQWGVHFPSVFDSTVGLNVPVSETALIEAGVPLVRDAIVVADVDLGAATAAEVQPQNLEAAGILPALTDVYIMPVREGEEA